MSSLLNTVDRSGQKPIVRCGKCNNVLTKHGICRPCELDKKCEAMRKKERDESEKRQKEERERHAHHLETKNYMGQCDECVKFLKKQKNAIIDERKCRRLQAERREQRAIHLVNVHFLLHGETPHIVDAIWYPSRETCHLCANPEKEAEMKKKYPHFPSHADFRYYEDIEYVDGRSRVTGVYNR